MQILQSVAHETLYPLCQFKDAMMCECTEHVQAQSLASGVIPRSKVRRPSTIFRNCQKTDLYITLCGVRRNLHKAISLNTMATLVQLSCVNWTIVIQEANTSQSNIMTLVCYDYFADLYIVTIT